MSINVENYITFVESSPNGALGYLKELPEMMYGAEAAQFLNKIAPFIKDPKISQNAKTQLGQVVMVLYDYMKYAYESKEKSKDLRIFPLQSYLSELEGQEKVAKYNQDIINRIEGLIMEKPQSIHDYIIENADKLGTKELRQICKALNGNIRAARSYSPTPDVYDSSTDILLTIYDYLDYAQEAKEKGVKVFGFKSYLLEEQVQFPTLLLQRKEGNSNGLKSNQNAGYRINLDEEGLLAMIKKLPEEQKKQYEDIVQNLQNGTHHLEYSLGATSATGNNQIEIFLVDNTDTTKVKPIELPFYSRLLTLDEYRRMELITLEFITHHPTLLQKENISVKDINEILARLPEDEQKKYEPYKHIIIGEIKSQKSQRSHREEKFNDTNDRYYAFNICGGGYYDGAGQSFVIPSTPLAIRDVELHRLEQEARKIDKEEEKISDKEESLGEE